MGPVGEHNMHNGLMAIAAARHVGVLPADAANALGTFINARRRLELRGEAHGVTVYDDFAHHPTAILATLAALRGKVGGTARILAVLEPRSNTMKMGICKDDLAPSLGRADEVFLLQPQHIPWQVAEVADACIQPAHWSADVDVLADMVVKAAQRRSHSGDEQRRVWWYPSEAAGRSGEESRGRRVKDPVALALTGPTLSLLPLPLERGWGEGLTLRSQTARADTGKSGALTSAAYSLLSLSSRYGSKNAAAGGRHSATGSALQVPRHHLARSDDRGSAPAYGTAQPAGCGGFQFVQRLTDRLHVALTQQFPDKLKLAATPFFLDFLCQFNGITQIPVERDLIQRVLPSSTISAPSCFNSSASRLISLLLTQMISSSSSSMSSPGTSSSQSSGCLVMSGSLKRANVTS